MICAMLPHADPKLANPEVFGSPIRQVIPSKFLGTRLQGQSRRLAHCLEFSPDRLLSANRRIRAGAGGGFSHWSFVIGAWRIQF